MTDDAIAMCRRAHALWLSYWRAHKVDPAYLDLAIHPAPSAIVVQEQPLYPNPDGPKTLRFYRQVRAEPRSYWCKEERLGFDVFGRVFTKDALGYLPLGEI